MSAESIVVSLENAKKLMEAGFPQFDGIFQWKQSMMTAWLILRAEVRDEMFDPRCFDNLMETANLKQYFAAPTAEEILRRLPRFVQSDEMAGRLATVLDDGRTWMVAYFSTGQGHRGATEDESLANAAAAMYCYLAEKLLQP